MGNLVKFLSPEMTAMIEDAIAKIDFSEDEFVKYNMTPEDLKVFIIATIYIENGN